MAFDFSLRTRIVFGPGSVARIGELVTGLGCRRAYLVTDAGIVAAGHAERVEMALEQSGCDVRRYDRVRENPTSAGATECVTALGDWNADVILGLGGGSSIDVAKACAFLRAGGGSMEDYWGVGKARGTLLPIVAVPTTAGTGSEVQSFALISQEGSHQKMACGDPQAAPRIAMLDPDLTVTQPRFVATCTGLDAIAHAVETAVTRKRTAISDLFSDRSFALAQSAFPRVIAEPGDVEARGRMLLAAAYAGIAIEASMLGAAHSMANPLTAQYGIAHGQAVGMMLPLVARYNATEPAARTRYAELARASGLCSRDADDAVASSALIDGLGQLLEVAGIDRSLVAHGVTRERIPDLAAEAAQQWTAQFNPKDVGEADFAELFAAACGG